MDIVERLRKLADRERPYGSLPDVMEEAADEIERLRKGYAEAIDEIESWGAYASPYFQEKWGLKEIVELHRSALQQKESE